MKKCLLFALMLLSGSMANILAQDYYWYNGNKMPLERGNQLYLIYEDDLLSESDKAQIVEGEEVFYPGYTNLKWGKTKPNAKIEDTKHVHYIAPSFKKGDKEDDNMFVTHRFYVKLKSKDGLAALQDLAAQNNAEIEEAKTGAFELWYVLRCKLDAPKNALELANLLYETSDLFTASEPEMINASELAGLELNKEQPSAKNKILKDGKMYILRGDKTYTLTGQEVK